MVEIFNAISNIAVEIENKIFKNYHDFVAGMHSDSEIHKAVYNFCTDVIESEFEHVRSVKGAIAKDKKMVCTINEKGKYLISYVSIDNVDLLDVNFALGSMFGVYEGKFGAPYLKAAIYVTYGPTFQIVFANSNGIQFFSYENGEFIQNDSFELKEKGKINATGGIAKEWSAEHKALIKSFFDEGYRLRLSDSLSMDVHHILFKRGGIYSSPSTKSFPKGKHEVIFEAFPVAYIIEKAGGEAVDGTRRILDIQYEDLHQQTPLYFGSKNEIEKVRNSF